jgi:hypothetical protein
MHKNFRFILVFLIGILSCSQTLPPSAITSSAANYIFLPMVMKPSIVNPSGFMFASMGDAQGDVSNYSVTVNQISSLNPNFAIFNGDLEDDGVRTSELDPMTSVLKNANIFNKTFIVRGNHDDHISGSATLWENYFETAPNIRVLPAGVSNYVAINSSSDTLTYSFIYGNSIFIGLDTPGDVDYLTSAQYTFLDSRLTYAENSGLVHAFIYFHGPMYCVESVHCDCPTKTDSSCTPTTLISVINKHPIVSAFFHGHEHILGWTHIDKTRLAAVTGNFEEFLTSSSGSTNYNSYLYPDRMDYTYMAPEDTQVFATVTVNGNSFTVDFYKTGTATPVWTKTFTKGTTTATSTPGVLTATSTTTRTPIATTSITPTVPLHYALNTDGDIADLSALGFNLFDVDGSAANVNALPAGTQALVWMGSLGNASGNSCSSPELSNAEFMAVVDILANNPKVFGYNLADEPDSSVCPDAPNLIKIRSDYIHTHAPTQKAFILLLDGGDTCPEGGGCEYYAFRPEITNADLFGLDPYPCRFNSAGQPAPCNTIEISQAIQLAIAKGIPASAIIPVFQAFGQEGRLDGEPINWRTPTTMEFQNILSIWKSLMPNPIFDIAYTWGIQCTESSCVAPQSLKNHPELQLLIKQYNLSLPGSGN